jgi:phospholipid/cholesterol/gamma-HCH transport system substrate-binding protein
MLIKKDVQPFIKSDCVVAIGSEGLIGDRLLIITHGSVDAPLAKEGQLLASSEPVETDAIMASLEVTAGNAEIISEQLAEIIFNINNGKGTIGKLIQDSTIAENLSQTMMHVNTSSQGLEENMEALKHNFLLRGYFTKQEKEAAKLLEEQQKEAMKLKKAEDKKVKQDQKDEDKNKKEEEQK